MHKSLLVILYAFLLPFGSMAQGSGNWQHATPGGHTIYNASSGATLALSKNHTLLQGLTGWYFYKHCIIGKTRSGFFVIDETNAATRQFGSFAEWDQYLQGAGLKPLLWTRWYSGNWRFYEQAIFPLVFMVLFVLFPALTYFVLTINEWISGVVKLQLKSKPLLIAAGLLLLSLLRFLLDLYPQSY